MKDFFEISIPLKDSMWIFALLLLIILVIPLIFKKLKLPGIIGLILSGVLIGQHGLDLIDDDSSIQLFSEIGLLYIMFIAGLDLDLTQFKIHKYKSVLLGLLTFIIPSSICFFIFYNLLDYSFSSSALISVMLSTQTLVSYPIVSKLGVSKNIAVAITVGATIITDTAVLIVLALIIGNQNNDYSFFPLLFLIGKIIIFLSIMFFVVPPISRLFFRKLESEKFSQFIYVLFVVFIAGILAKLAGLEPIIGAFMAGLVLNNLIPHSSTLMNRINFVGNALFIPIFLISIGMLINLRLIFQDFEILLYALLLSSIAITGKWIVAFLIQKISKYSGKQRQLIFGLISSKAAATLAVVIVGKSAGLIDEQILNATILVILITCIISSFVTEKAAMQIVLDEENIDSKKRKIIFIKKEHILVPIGNFEQAERILDFSSLIINKSLEHEITLLSVVEADENSDVNYLKSKNKLQEKADFLNSYEIKTNITLTIDSNVAGGIVRVSKEQFADIIVLDWERSRNVVEKFLGSTIDKITEQTELSLFVCDFQQSLQTIHKIIIFSLPFSELEIGFLLWLQKIISLAKEIKKPLIYYCTLKTQNAVIKIINSIKTNVKINFINIEDWKSINDLKIETKTNDLIVFTAIRKGAISYKGMLDNIFQKLEKYFPDNSKIVIFPEEKSVDYDIEIFNDINSSPINRGLEKFESLKKLFKFKKKEKRN
ncbi:MAG: cation:proton antiporter [Bacteroidales bacterium]|jgi:Kef-type K+ transport system membrane component KefB|nr:cation:proton antiporter [Bacteroidales bacterium]